MRNVGSLGPNGPIDQTEPANGSAQIGQPIPDTKPDVDNNVNVNESQKNTTRKRQGSWLKQLPDIDVSQEDREHIVATLRQVLADENSNRYFDLVARKLPVGKIQYILQPIRKSTSIRESRSQVFTSEIEKEAKKRAEQGRLQLPDEFQGDIEQLYKTKTLSR